MCPTDRRSLTPASVELLKPGYSNEAVTAEKTWNGNCGNKWVRREGEHSEEKAGLLNYYSVPITITITSYI